MKNVLFGGALMGSVILAGCVKEQGGRYENLSTRAVVYSVPNGPAGETGSASLNNATFIWNAASRVMTIQCDAGYGYVKSAWDMANNSPNTDISATNLQGDQYTSTYWYLEGVGILTLSDDESNKYPRPTATDGQNRKDFFTCVPLSTDGQWA